MGAIIIFLISKNFIQKRLDVHKVCTQSRITRENQKNQMLKKLKKSPIEGEQERPQA